MNIVDDPIVAETRAIRNELAERFGNDVNALCDFLTTREAEHEELLVNRPPKAPHPMTSVADGSRQ